MAVLLNFRHREKTLLFDVDELETTSVSSVDDRPLQVLNYSARPVLARRVSLTLQLNQSAAGFLLSFFQCMKLASRRASISAKLRLLGEL